MAGLIMPNAAPSPMATPAVPTIDTQAVKQTAEADQRKRSLMQGRASTLLTDPSTQRTPELYAPKMALGGI
jgi:hypothetical protein